MTTDQEPMSLVAGEEPLVGLCPKPMHLMTEAELTQFVLDLRTIRSSPQTKAARMEHRAKKVAKAEKEEAAQDRVALFDDLI